MKRRPVLATLGGLGSLAGAGSTGPTALAGGDPGGAPPDTSGPVGGPAWVPTGLTEAARRIVLAGQTPYAVTVPGGGAPGGGAATALWRGDPAGGPWTPLAAPVPRVADLAAHPDDPRILYVAGDGGIHRSLDAGATWERVVVPLPSSRRPARRRQPGRSGPSLRHHRHLQRRHHLAEPGRRGRLGGPAQSPGHPLHLDVPGHRPRPRRPPAGLPLLLLRRWPYILGDPLGERRPLGDGRGHPAPADRHLGRPLSFLFPAAAAFDPAGRRGWSSPGGTPGWGAARCSARTTAGRPGASCSTTPRCRGPPGRRPARGRWPTSLLAGNPEVRRLVVGLAGNGQGTLRSEDGGATWAGLGSPAIGRVDALAGDPAGVLYAATDRGSGASPTSDSR